jgi:hypothetical protein
VGNLLGCGVLALDNLYLFQTQSPTLRGAKKPKSYFKKEGKPTATNITTLLVRYVTTV